MSRGLLGSLQKMPPDQAWIDQINGQPVIIATLHGKPYGVVLLEVQEGHVRRVYAW